MNMNGGTGTLQARGRSGESVCVVHKKGAASRINRIVASSRSSSEIRIQELVHKHSNLLGARRRSSGRCVALRCIAAAAAADAAVIAASASAAAAAAAAARVVVRRGCTRFPSMSPY